MSNRILQRHFPGPPSDWLKMQISDALDEVDQPIRMRDTEIYDLVSIRRRNGGVFRRESLPGREILTKTLRRVVPGTFVIARMQIVHGASALATSEFDGCAISKSYSSFKGTSQCDASYFAWLAKLPFMYAYFLDASHGVVIEKMTFDQQRWLSLPVYLPPVSEQRRVTEILDTVDEALGSKERLIGKLEQMTHGLLNDLLSRGIDDAGRVRDPERNPERFVDTQLGQLPREWSIVPLEDLSAIAGGVTLGRSVSGLGTVTLPYLRVANVQDGFVDTSEMKLVRVFQEEVAKYRLESGDVLMTEGGDFDKLGRGAVWDGRIDTCLHQNHIFRVRCDRSRLLPQFLAAFSASTSGKKYFLRSSKQTTNLASINMTQLKAYPVATPSLAEQERIIEVLNRHDMRIVSESRSIAKLRILRVGLMHDLLTGRVRVAADNWNAA